MAVGLVLDDTASRIEFKSFEYQQSKQIVAGEDVKSDILKAGIRKLEHDTGVSHHTLEKILRAEPVRRIDHLQVASENVSTISNNPTS
jgi:hypothetical protein